MQVKIKGSATSGPEYYNQAFLDAAEHYDKAISLRKVSHPNYWRDRIPRGQLTPFSGIVQQNRIFHQGVGAQVGLSEWRRLQMSRAASGGDPGFNSCIPPPAQTFTHGIEARSFTGQETAWASEPFCVNDLKYVEMATEQLKMALTMLQVVSDSVWTTLNRESYLYMTFLSGRQYILTGGLPELAEDSANRFYYNPYVVDSNGDNYLLYPQAEKPSAMIWGPFESWREYLEDECPDGAIAKMEDGECVFGLALNKRDVRDMIRQDPELRTTYNEMDPIQLIDGYGRFKKFDGYALIHDRAQPRFNPVSAVTDPGFYGDTVVPAGTYIKAVRVKPIINGRALQVGYETIMNPAYPRAELALSVCAMENVYVDLLEPSTPTNLAGMTFGPTPGYNGNMTWINEYDKETNPMKTTGYFYGRWAVFQKTLENSRKAYAALYRRCVTVKARKCDIEIDNAANTSAITLAVAVAGGDIDATNRTVWVTLAKGLPCGVGSKVTLTLKSGGPGSTPTTGYIVDDTYAGLNKYLIAFAASGTIAAGDLDTTATVVCA